MARVKPPEYIVTRIPGIPQPNGIRIQKDLSFPLYRYTKKSRHQKFMINGELYLNTLFFFQKSEELGNEVGDLEEGLRSYNSYREDPDSIEETLFYMQSTVNCWIMCLTEFQDDRFFEEFNSDCCIKIISPEYFIEIANAARDVAPVSELVRIQYIDTREIVDEIRKLPADARSYLRSFLPSQIKSRRYSWQREVRFMLEPFSSDPDGYITKSFNGIYEMLLKFDAREVLSRLEPTYKLEKLLF
jgi:hypothetical protein